MARLCRLRYGLVVAIISVSIVNAAPSQQSSGKYCVVSTPFVQGGTVLAAGTVVSPLNAVLKTKVEGKIYGALSTVFPTGGLGEISGRASSVEQPALLGCEAVDRARKQTCCNLFGWLVQPEQSCNPCNPLHRAHTLLAPTTTATCPTAAELPAALASAYLAEPERGSGGFQVDRLVGSVELDMEKLGTVTIDGYRVSC